MFIDNTDSFPLIGTRGGEAEFGEEEEAIQDPEEVEPEPPTGTPAEGASGGDNPPAGGGNEKQPVSYDRFHEVNQKANMLEAQVRVAGELLQNPKVRAAFREGYIERYGQDPFPQDGEMPKHQPQRRQAEVDEEGFEYDPEAGELTPRERQLMQKVDKLEKLSGDLVTQVAHQRLNTALSAIEAKYGVSLTQEYKQAIMAEVGQYGNMPMELAAERAYRVVAYEDAVTGKIGKREAAPASEPAPTPQRQQKREVVPPTPGGPPQRRTEKVEDFDSLDAALNAAFRES